MGCTNGSKIKMSKNLYSDVLATFDKLDKKTNKRISISQMDQYWTGPYTKTYTQVLFKEMDLNANGTISKDQWIAYWELALRSGYTENDIIDCIRSIEQGKLQMEFSKIRTYDQNKSRSSVVEGIISDLTEQFQ